MTNVYLDFQDGAGYRDISSYVKYDSLVYTNKGCSDTFHYAQNEASFDVIYNAALYALLKNATTDILVNIKKSGVDDFTGRIFPTKARTYNGILNNTTISLSAEDSTQKLDVDIGDVVYFGYAICNPASPATSIVHQLCYRAGFAPAKITSSVTIAKTITAFAPESENDSILDVLDTLLFEYGYVLHFNESDVLTPVKWITSDSVSTNFTEANMIQEVEVEDSVKDYYGLTTTYYEIGQIETTSGYSANIKLYQDSNCSYDSNGNFTGYEITPGYLYPPACNAIDTTTSGSSIVYQEYDDSSSKYWTNYAIVHSLDYNYKVFDSDFSSIIATSGCYMDAGFDTGITVDMIHFYNKKARIVLKNPTASYLTLRYLDIRGYVWYRTAARIAEVNNTTVSGQKLDTYVSTFLHTQADASTFTTYLAKQYDIGATFYTVMSDKFADVGTVCNVTMNDGTNQNCLIMSRQWNEAVRYYTYKVRAQDNNVGTLTRQSITVKENPTVTETVTSELTQSTIAVLPIAYGGSPDFTYAYTDLYIYQGERNMSRSWAYSITTSGITGSFGTGDNPNRYTVSGLSGTSGSGTITATKLGFADVVVSFTVALGAVEAPTLSLSSHSATRSRTNVITPSGLLLAGKLSSGGAYAGRFKIAYSVDGSSYNNVYTSSVDETTHSYAVPATATVSGVTHYVTNIKAQLYAMGGTTLLCDEKICGVSADASTTPLYWGALTTAPSGYILPNDYYWNNNVTISGGGILEFYSGSAWAEADTSWYYYHTALGNVDLLGDMGAWATAQATVIAAASAIFAKLVTADAFIANLFAQTITIPAGGKQRWYDGQGVQRRCIELKDGRFSFIDAPDTSPASPELLRGVFGRLGVNGPAILDGDWQANILSESSEAIDLNIALSTTDGVKDILETPNGAVRIMYINTSGHLCERLRTGAIIGSEVEITAANVSGCYLTDADGRVYAVYNLSGSVYIQEFITSWGAPTLFIDDNCTDFKFIVDTDSKVRIMYSRSNGTYERIFYSGSLGNEATIDPSSKSPVCYGLENNGTLVAYLEHSSASQTVDLYRYVYLSGTWAAPESPETTVSAQTNDSVTGLRALFEINGDMRVCFRSSPHSGFLYEVVRVKGVWQSMTAITKVKAYTSVYTQLKSGYIETLYSTGGTIFSITLRRYARVGAGIIEEGNTAANAFDTFGNKSVECRGWGAINGNGTTYSNVASVALPITPSEAGDVIVQCIGYKSASASAPSSRRDATGMVGNDISAPMVLWTSDSTFQVRFSSTASLASTTWLLFSWSFKGKIA